MKPSTDKSFEKNTKTPDFQRKLDEITSRQLDARTIDTYADDALQDLVNLVDQIVGSQLYQAPLSSIENERRALAANGLDPNTVEITLDHIAEVADSTKQLDALIMKKTKLIDSVIVPPDPTKKTDISAGDGSFEKPKEIIPKLKTLLLLLEKGLNIDIEDDKEVKITAGALRPNMMRGMTYRLVEIPSLNRIVLVCDEVGNTTYVFDTDICGEYGIDAEYLSEQQKPSLDSLVKEDEQLGVRIDYSKKYADRLGDVLAQPLNATSKVNTVTILKPRDEIENVPDGYLSLPGVCELLGIGRGVLARARSALADELGPVLMAKFGDKNRIAQAYSPEQVNRIKEYLIEQGLAGFAPDGYLSLREISEKTGISEFTIQRVVKELVSELGRVLRVRSGEGNGYLYTYSPEQYDLILAHMEAKGTTTNVELSDFKGAKELAEDFGIDRNTITRVVKKLSEELGDVIKAKLGESPVPRPVYSKSQQAIIRQYLKDKNILVPLLPAGYKSQIDIARTLGISYGPVERAIEELGDRLGSPTEARANSFVFDAYSPAQQNMIKDHLEADGTIIPLPPEGYLSAKGIEKITGLTRGAIKRAIDALGDELGLATQARVGSNRTSTYSPEQQKIIMEWLEQNMRRRSDSKVDFGLAKAALREYSDSL